jgi:L-2-hydroxyglutarate oxidase
MKTIGIVGGGIVGLTIAHKVQQKYPNFKVVLFEKEDKIGKHQSGRNSGVLHCGLYYQPGSLKAQLAVTGIKKMTEFCQLHSLPHEICGKVVVANGSKEIKLLNNLAERGKQNGLDGLRFLSASELKLREPFVKADNTLLVPQEGIVDYKAVMYKLVDLILYSGGEIYTNSQIENVIETKDKLEVVSNDVTHSLDYIISCSGLFSDRVFKKFTNEKRPLRIVPFRGEYMMLTDDSKHLINHLVYPVPDPEYPFLGVHFTRLINGSREVGPNAVFAFKREGYRNFDFSLADTLDSLLYQGFLSFIFKNFSFSLGEFKSSLSKKAFLSKAKKMIPEIELSHLMPGTAGVRAQAINSSGKLLMDFNIIRKKNQVHVLNAPSPGATASLAIADHIVDHYLSDL